MADDAGALTLVRAVNRAVNTGVPNISDRRRYGRGDLWTLPGPRGGDREDFAPAKNRRLIEAGVPAGALLIATALDRRRKPRAVASRLAVLFGCNPESPKSMPWGHNSRLLVFGATSASWMCRLDV